MSLDLDDGYGLGSKRLIFTTALRGRLQFVHPTHSLFLYWLLNYWLVCIFEAYAVFRCATTMRHNIIPVTTLTNACRVFALYIVPLLFHLNRIPASSVPRESTPPGYS